MLLKIGKYDVVEQLGQGGMAVVYKARDALLDRVVAIKLVNQQLQDNSLAVQRFFNEAKVAASLSDHQNIVTVHDMGIENGRPYIVMEFLQGYDLRRVIAKKRSMSLRRKISIALQIAKALRHAHARGVVHRDIKPENIWLQDGKSVKLLDFGIAKLLSESAPQNLTSDGNAIGTFSYMSPEQLQGKTLDFSVDIFSYGIILYEFFSFIHPFQADVLPLQIYKIISEEPPPLKAEAVPSEVQEIIMTCLRKDPSARFPSFEPIVQELSSLMQRLKFSEDTGEKTLPRVHLAHVGVGGLDILEAEDEVVPHAPTGSNRLSVDTGELDLDSSEPEDTPGSSKRLKLVLLVLFFVAIALGVGTWSLYKAKPGKLLPKSKHPLAPAATPSPPTYAIPKIAASPVPAQGSTP